MRILVSGALGHMGQAVMHQAEEKGIAALGVDIRSQDASDCRIYSNMNQVKEKVDVLIDFSSPDALDAVLEYALFYKVPCVLCTTGYDDQALERIREASEKIPVFRSANMSLGISVISFLAREASRILREDFDVEIIETHHRRKKDAPSGTALMLRDAVCEAGGGKGGTAYGRHGSQAQRVPGEIGIHAVRGGTVTGTHEIRFLGAQEEISIAHVAEDRAVFAAGALQAALYLKDKQQGSYSMNDLLSEKLG